MERNAHWPRHVRDLDGAWLSIEDLRDAVDNLRVADEIAEKVAAAIRTQRTFALTGLQKLGGALLGGVALADLVLQLTGHR